MAIAVTRILERQQSPPLPHAQGEERTPITGEELAAMGDIGPSELIAGEIIRMNPTGYLHGIVESNFGRTLGNFVAVHPIGRVLVGEVGLYIARRPDTVRAADVAFISNARMAQVKSRSYLDVAPELIVEIMSPDDRWSAVMEKLGEYFKVGVQQVWIADPDSNSMYVYHSLTDVEHLTMENTLTGGDILPGFAAPVRDFFLTD